MTKLLAGMEPDTNGAIDRHLIWRVASRLSILRSVYLSLSFHGFFLVARGTRLKFGKGARIRLEQGAFLCVGFAHFTPVARLHAPRGGSRGGRVGNSPDTAGVPCVRERRRSAQPRFADLRQRLLHPDVLRRALDRCGMLDLVEHQHPRHQHPRDHRRR